MTASLSQPELTLFYDAQCPICATEIKHLKKRDHHQRIEFVDIHADHLQQRYPMINPEKASDLLHGLTANGQLILGLDATHKAWSLVGLGYLTAVLRLPLICTLADRGYRLFARNRHQLSSLLTGSTPLSSCKSCQNPKGNP